MSSKEKGKVTTANSDFVVSSALLNVAQSASLRGLKHAAQAASVVFGTIERVQGRMAEDFQIIADDAADLIIAIWRLQEMSENPKKWVSPEIRHMVGNLKIALEKVSQMAERQATRNIVVRSIYNMTDAGQIRQTREMIATMVSRFQVHWHIKMNELLLEVASNHQSLVQDMEHLKADRAVREEEEEEEEEEGEGEGEEGQEGEELPPYKTTRPAQIDIALICEKCFAHNGLVKKSIWEDAQYVCPECNHFNAPTRSKLSASGTVTNLDSLGVKNADSNKDYYQDHEPLNKERVKLLNDGDSNIHALSKLSQQAEFRSLIGPVIPDIVNLLFDRDGDSNVRVAYAMLKLSQQAEFQPLIGPVIPQIANLLFDHDGDSNVHMAYADVLSKLSQQAEFQPLISPVIPQIVKLLFDRDGDSNVRVAYADVLSKLSQQAQFRPLIGPVILEIVNLLFNRDDDSNVRVACAYVLLKLSHQAEFQPLIGPVIPEIVNLLFNRDDDSNVRVACVYVLLKLSQQAEFQPLIGPVIPEIVNLLIDRDGDSNIRVAYADVLLKLSQQVEFRPLIGPVIPQIVNLLFDRDGDSNVRVAYAYVLLKLSQQAEFQPLIGPVIPEVVNLLKQHNGPQSMSRPDREMDHKGLRSTSGPHGSGQFIQSPLIIGIPEIPPDPLCHEIPLYPLTYFEHIPEVVPDPVVHDIDLFSVEHLTGGIPDTTESWAKIDLELHGVNTQDEAGR